jgi:mono/diheme cytochrome c family protein
MGTRFPTTALLVCAVFAWTGSLAAAPQTAAAPAAAAEPAPAPAPALKPPMKDPYQRSVETYEFKVTAKEGAQRGEELFNFKCSFCHTRYAKAELMRDIPLAPPLESYASRPGISAADAAARLTAKIQRGGFGMPAYRHTLNDADVADLVAYVLSGKCCTDGENPPPNPHYRGASSPAKASR